MVDRREDIGNKIIVGVLIGVIMLFLGLFINAAWATASEGKNKAFEIGERMTAMEGRFNSFQSDLVEIKDLLKRQIPKNNIN